MKFSGRIDSKLSLGNVLVTLLIAGPFGYFGVTLLGGVRTQLAGFALLGVALLMIGSLVWQAIRLIIERYRPQRQHEGQVSGSIRRLDSISAVLPSVAIVVGAAAFGIVFIVNRLWVPAIITGGTALAWIVMRVTRVRRPDTSAKPPATNQLLMSWPNVVLGSAIFIVPAVWLAVNGRWMLAVFIGSMSASLLAFAGLKERQHRQFARTHPYRMLLFAVPIFAGVLLFASSGEWFGALIVGLFGAIFLVIVAVVLAERRLGHRMRAPLPSAIDSPLPVPTQADPTDDLPLNRPNPPFVVTVFDLTNVPPVDTAAQELIDLRLQSNSTSALVYRRGASQLWFWLAGMLLFVFLGNGSVRPYDFPLFLIGCMYHLVTLWTPSEKTQRAIWMVNCFLVNGAWLLSVVFVAAFSALRLFQGVVTLGIMVFTIMTNSAPPSVMQFLSLSWTIFTNLAVLALGGAGLIRYRRLMRRERAEHARSLPTDQPLKLLFLWVFGSDAVMEILWTKIGVSWGLLGSMQLLCGRGYMGAINEVLPALVSAQRDPLVETPAELQAKLRSFNHAPSWNGRFATNSLLCHDSVWRAALEALLADNQVVLMSLGGFSAENSGCVYELGRLIDHLPTERFLLLVDDQTDMDALNTTLEAAWAAMRADSPNRVAGATIQLYHTRWFAVAPLRGDRDNPLTPEQAAFEQLRAQSVQRESEHVVNLLCAGALASARLHRTAETPTPPDQIDMRES